jgi:hypothetical protein
MSVTTGSQMPPKMPKPYVYRGTGEDQFPETRMWGGDPKPKPTRAQRAEARRQKKVARQRRADRLRAKRERERAAHQARMDAKRAAGWKPGDEGRAAMAKRRAREAAAREEWKRQHQHPTPAPGWRPLAGDDLDALLEELE